MPFETLKLAWQLTRHEKSTATLRFLSWTQILLLVFVLTLSQTSASIQDYLNTNLQQLLGADLVISQNEPLNPSQLQQLGQQSAQIVVTQTVSLTLTHRDKWQQISLKAIDKDYPLQGTLRTSISPTAVQVDTHMGPSEGEIWVDARLLSSLSLEINQPIEVAGSTLRVSRILHHEPDRLMEGHSVAMRAMVSRVDFERLNIEAGGNRFRYLVAANSAQIESILDWQKNALPTAQMHHKNGAHPLALFWQRTENFLGLTSILLFFMAAIAIQQLTQIQIHKEQFLAAVCVSLGATRTLTWQISILKWFVHLLSLLPWVLVLSVICHFALTHWLGSIFSDIQYRWHPWVIVQNLWFGMLLFALFQLPVWLAVRHASVAQLLHNTQSKTGKLVSLLCVLLVLTALAIGYSDNALLTTMLLGTMAVCIVLMLIISWLFMTLGEKFTQRLSGLLPFTLYMMKQRLLSKTTQILGVGLCAFLLLFTLMFMRDLGNTLSAHKRQHDGNLVVTQATAEQWQAIESLADNHDIDIRQHKPFVYAQMTHINGLSLSEHSDKPSDSMATLQDSIRLHWSEAIPQNNKLVQGQWWSADTQNWQQVSIEVEIMTDLGLQIGDSVTLFIAGQATDFKISASHQYRPGAGSITFWVQMPSSALAHINAPHYAMASLEVDDQNLGHLTSLWQSHPTLRITSLKEMTERFDKMLALVIQVVSGFAVLISLLAIIVILSSVHGTIRSEQRKNSIILSFGFSPSTCLKLYLWEWLITACIAACGAILGTWMAGILIYQSQFSISYQPEPAWLLATLLVILLSVVTLGVLASKRSLSSSVRTLLAE